MKNGSVEELLSKRIGLDVSSVGPGLIASALRRRMAARGLDADAQETYARLARASSAEFQALLEEVVTPETWFLRDVEPFRWLAARVAEIRARRPTAPPFRVLSAPCATGEEPYSIALSFLDAGLLAEQFQIDAIDASARAIATARRGLYTSNSFRTTDTGFRRRYFHGDQTGFRIDESISRLVRFRVGNLLDPALVPSNGHFDAIFCRNLLIYLHDEARARLIANLDRWLAPGGVLVLGHADHVRVLERGFKPAGPRATFSWERIPAAPPGEATPGPTPVRHRVATLPTNSPSPPTHPSALPSRRASSTPRTSARVSPLDRISALADEGRHDEAGALCEREIAERGPTAPAYFQLGMIRQAQGRLDEAEAALRKAVYLDGRHEEALLALGLIAQRRGNLSAARNLRKRAARAFHDGDSR